MNKDEIEAMGKFFRQAFDMSNGSSPDVKYEMTQKAKDTLKEMDKRIDKLVAYDCDLVTQVDTAVKKGTEGRRKLQEDLANRISMLEEEYKSDLKRLRGDYRSLQNEMWERFDLIEEWILADTSRDKQKFRDEIIDIRTDHEKQKNYTMLKADQKVTPETWAGVEIKIPPKSETSQSIAWAKIPISKLELSVRSHNALITGGYHYVGNIITQSPHDLIQIRNFGRKCLREVMKALEEKSLTLNMKKFKEQQKARRLRIHKQFNL